MGRNRKTQFGSTNNDIKKQFLSTSLSISSSTSSLQSPSISKSSLIENHVYTQKVITPNTKSLDVDKNSDRRYNSIIETLNHLNYLLSLLIRNIKVISTWNPKDMYQRKFLSETNDGYTDPEYLRLEKLRIKEERQKQALAEAGMNEKAPLIFKKLGEETDRKYGGAAKMFKIVGNKETNDIITLNEMSDYFKKANLDETIPETDQKYIFESLDEKGHGRIPVFKLLERVDIKDPQQTKDMKIVRNFLADEILKLQGLSNSASSNTILHHKSKEVDELMRRSMSQKTFDLEIDPISFNNLIEEKVNDPTLNAEERKIARYLRITNLQMNLVPFYDTRADVITNLKEKAEKTQEELKGECEKLKKLQIIKKQLNDVSPNDASKVLEGLSVTQSLNEKQFSDGRVSTSPSKPRLMTTPINKRYLSKEGVTAPRNLAGSINDVNYFADADKIEMYSNNYRPQTTPIKSNASSPTRSQIYDYNSSTIDDFSPNKNDASFRPKLKDSSVVLIEGLKYTEPEKRPAKRELNDYNVHINNEHDWSNMDQTSGSFASVDETFKTTNSRYFTPVIYEATKNPRREVIPDSTKNLAAQEAKRTVKYNRAQLSIAITENRLALQEQDKVVRRLQGDILSNTKKYHYETLVLSDDLRLFKKTPLEMVSKKPHYSRYSRMWTGNLGPVNQPEQRDFLSTYNASFNDDMKTISLDPV